MTKSGTLIKNENKIWQSGVFLLLFPTKAKYMYA